MTEILNIVDPLGQPTVVIVTSPRTVVSVPVRRARHPGFLPGPPYRRWLIGFGAGLGAGAATAFFFVMPRSEELAEVAV